MDDLEEELLLLLLLRRRRRKQKNLSKVCAKRRFWVRSIFTRRQELGEYNQLISELRNEDREYFFR